MLVRLKEHCQIKLHVPPSKQIPANFFKFRSCDLYPQVEYLLR